VSLDALDYHRALGRLIDCHDEPIPSSGVLYQFVLRQRMAEAGCQAVLVGYGADEIFSGYRYLAPPFLAALARHGRLSDVVRFVRGGREFLESSPAGIVASALRYSAARAKRALLPCRPAFANSDVLAPLDDRAGLGQQPRFAEFDLSGLGRGHIFFAALLECFRTNIALLVRLEDRNAAAHGLELCAPFMDESLVQAALSFEFHRYMSGGRNKAILRDAAAELLAPEVRLQQRKLATPGNDAHLVFEILRPELLELLSSERFYESGFWSRRCLDAFSADSARGIRADLWFRVYMVHRWYEQVVKRPSF
jgi:asparagine synthetase B (glutamine-hydrolysing)